MILIVIIVNANSYSRNLPSENLILRISFAILAIIEPFSKDNDIINLLINILGNLFDIYSQDATFADLVNLTTDLFAFS